MLIAIIAFILGSAWIVYEIKNAREIFVNRCMECEEEINDDMHFCDAGCQQKYREHEQYHETKDFK